MKEIQLTKGKVAFIDDEDFEYIMQWKWTAYKGRNTYYAKRNMNNKGDNIGFQMHRSLMRVYDRSILIDHIDGNGLNNQKANLRICNYSQNGANKLKRKGSNGTKFIGITFRKDTKKWAAQVMKDYKHISLGCYNSDIDAAIAYNKKAVELHGEFAVLNKIPNG